MRAWDPIEGRSQTKVYKNRIVSGLAGRKSDGDLTHSVSASPTRLDGGNEVSYPSEPDTLTDDAAACDLSPRLTH